MSGRELNKIRQDTVKTLEGILKDNLFVIISAGSVAWGDYKKLWSDVDILIVVEKINLETKQKIAIARNVLEKKYKKHFGINVINKQEFQEPILPSISLEGKTLQALLETKMFPDRIIFCKDKLMNINKIYSPDKNDLKNYSISSIAMFLLRNRRTLSDKKIWLFKNYKNIVAKEMRASFIMTKLAIQYFTFHVCSDNKEVVYRAEKLFPDFDFQALKTNLQIIAKWNKAKERSQLDAILQLNDSFIENFSHYVFEKTKK